ncbi:MAG: DNA-directed RNA polymerase subunit alpha C-terminal domain-containing protein, partial [Planctomycetota bacterium]
MPTLVGDSSPMAATATLDIRELVTGTGPFGPTEVRAVVEALSSDPAAHHDLRTAVQELEGHGERSPAASVRLGVCQQLLGRCREAAETLKTADGGALALFHHGLAAAEEGLHDKACELFDAAKKAGYETTACVAAAARTLRRAGRVDDAQSRLSAVPEAAAAASAEVQAERAAALADKGDQPEAVIALLEKALALDPGNPTALFHMALLHDRHGNDDDAIACYERAVHRYPANVGSLINLGLLYEDRDEFAKAQRCYKRVLEVFPDHARARMFLKDSSAGSDLKQDEQLLRNRDRLDQILALPVTDFELSVRSRNCLQKMGIQTLGDLARTTEEEILASKNFGETSLVEIKEMLASKGLSLGQLAAPVAAEELEPELAEPSADEAE